VAVLLVGLVAVHPVYSTDTKSLHLVVKLRQEKRLASPSVGCHNENGSPVDWFIVYKLPNGNRYAYLDSNARNAFAMSRDQLNSNTGAVARTLQQVYSSSNGHLMYNDEDPSGTGAASNVGHSKGVLGFSSDGGFWLIHSVPRFPLKVKGGNSGSLPADETIYGQTFLCLTLSAPQLDKVGVQLQYNHVGIYDSNIASFASALPNVAAVISGTYIHTAGSNKVVLNTAGGQQFTSYAKSAKWGRDLYADLVAADLGTSLRVESWMRPKLKSDCSGTYHVVNVATVNIGGNTFSETQDHSKWAVSTNSGTNWACVGDINHMKSQFKRGGGTVCINDASVHNAFSSIIASAEDCH